MLHSNISHDIVIEELIPENRLKLKSEPEDCQLNSDEVEFDKPESDVIKHKKVNKRSKFFSKIKINPMSGNTLGSACNVVAIIIGIGILGVPYAIMVSGWVGIIIIVVSAFVCCSTGKMVVDCLYETFDNNIRYRVFNTYQEIGAKVWPRFGYQLVIVISIIDMFGATTLYVILLGTASYNLFNRLANKLTEQHWFIIGASLVLLLLFIKQMSIISCFSLIAVISLLGTLLSITIYCITKYSEIDIKNICIIHASKLPISCGIIVFSYAAHPVLPTIEGHMLNSGSYDKVMNISYTIATITKLIFGVIPVLIFGSKTSQTISANVLYSDFGFFVSSKIFVIFNVFFSIPLIIYVVLDTFDKSILPHFHTVFWSTGKLYVIWLFLSRLITIVTILLTALIVPYFALVMGFIGSFTATFMTFIFPCWFSLVLKAKELNIFQKLYRISVIILGSIIGCMGMVFSVIAMYNISKAQ